MFPALSARRFAGFAMAAVTILALGALAFHPTESGHEAGPLFAAIIADRSIDSLVHGVLIAIMIVLAYGFCEFATLLGWDRPLVRLGLVAYLIGCVAVILAGAIDGFVIPDVAQRFAQASADQASTGLGLIILCALFIQTLTKLGLVLLSAGIFAWSLALPRHSDRVGFIAGLIAGLLPLVFLLGLNPALGPHLLMLIWLVQGLWNFAAARLLLRTTP